MKEMARTEVSMREQSLLKEVRQKCIEIEELRKKARKRKEKVRALQRENNTLKSAMRDLEIKSVLSQQPGAANAERSRGRTSVLSDDDKRSVNSRPLRATENFN